ncbi:hypothetical protein O1611_g7937 [Lasiodiplodia mahajangana]|uniref:Uncharacterized protein n=1 Tax=Lasiodiplodia mahajangana TaxID=1108764 RepID=A0ACC2JE71_9PEZI|nr:hypothetical protein O1611_g7937 [Lasiodiplodia mahajangana]
MTRTLLPSSGHTALRVNERETLTLTTTTPTTTPLATTAPEVVDRSLGGLHVVDPRPQQLASSDPGQGKITHKIYHLIEKRNEYTEFLDWGSSESSLLWVSGEHGPGKTILLHGIVQALYEQPDSPNIAFFFFSCSSHESDNATVALRHLIWLIITKSPFLEQHLKDKLSTTGRKHFNNPNDFLALSTLFFNIIQDSAFPNTYLIVDSLDECKHYRTDFMELVVKSVSMCNRIKWLLSSNHDLSKHKLEGTRWQHLDLAADMYERSVTMYSYIKYAVSALAISKLYNEGLRRAITIRLSLLDIKSYVWIDIVCAALLSMEAWQAEGFVDQVETRQSLQDLYTLLHSRINSQKQDSALCTDILLAMGVAYRPLDLNQLERLMNWSSPIDINAIVQRCSGFLQVRGVTVSFRHESARKYVEQNMLGPPKTSDTHAKFTIRCLKFLGESFGNEYPIPHDSVCGQQAATIASSYESSYWMKHLTRVSNVTENVEIRRAVFFFLEKHFLHWVDALSLGDKVTLATSRLWQADTILGETVSADSNILAYVLQDAHFLWLHRVHPWLSKAPEIDHEWSPNFATFLGHEDYVGGAAISTDGRVLASGSDDGTVRIWDTETGTTQHTFRVGRGPCGYVQHVAISAGVLAAGPNHNDEGVLLWDLVTGSKLGQLPKYTNRSKALCLSADGRKVAVSNGDNVYVWIIDRELDGCVFKEHIVYRIHAKYLAFLNDDELVILAGNVIQLWNMNSLRIRRKCTSPTSNFTCAALSSCKLGERRLLASGSEDGSICIWCLDDDAEFPGNTPTHTAQPCDEANGKGHSEKKETHSSGEEDNIPPTTLLLEIKSDQCINSVAFSPDGSRIASASESAINIWERCTGRCLHTFQTPGLHLRTILFAPGRGDYLVSGNHINGTCHNAVQLWRVNQGLGEVSAARSLAMPHSIHDLTIHPDGRLLAGTRSNYARSNYTAFLWDLQRNTIADREMNFKHRNSLRSLSFSPNGGHKLLSTSKDRTAQICDVATGNRLYVLEGHNGWIRCAAWSPDGKYVATGSDDGSIRVWKLEGRENQEAIAILEKAHGGLYITTVAFSFDGKYLISGGGDEKVVIWEQINSETWQRKHEPLEGHTKTVASVLVTPDTKYVLSASWDKTLRKWDLESGEEILPRVEIDWVDFKMWWNMSGVVEGKVPSHVVTPQGAWPHGLPSTAAGHQAASQWHIRCDDVGRWWVAHGNKDIIYLPRQYLPRSSLVLGGRVVIGPAFDHVYFMDLKDEW